MEAMGERLSNGLSLRESPWDPALTYRALPEGVVAF